MSKKILVITDLEGALISSRAPEVDGRRYLSVMKNKWDKKVMSSDNVSKLKELNAIADIVPMTKQSAKQCSSMALCINTPMSLVEGGAILLNGIKPDKKWQLDTLEVTFPDDDLLRNGRKFLAEKGYEKNGDNECTLDFVALDGRDVENDIEELKDLIGSKYNVIKAGKNRIYAYHSALSRRAMVQKFIDTHPYETVITIAADKTGWLLEGGNSISIEGNNATYEYPLCEYTKDPHLFAAFALDKALEIAKG